MNSITRPVRVLLHILAKPVRKNDSDSGIIIQAYKGYGSRQKMYLMGRVFKQMGDRCNFRDYPLLSDILDNLRRVLRWGLGDIDLCAEIGDCKRCVTTDSEGYFHITLEPSQLPVNDTDWYSVKLWLDSDESSQGIEAEGYVYVAPEAARFVVISDIDDTVMYTGVANKIMMIWRLFFTKARGRVPFPGVEALYKALHSGKAGGENNPMLYVSRAPWSIYEVLDAFFKMHNIPVGPILFLRDWGMTLQHPLPHRSEEHKLELIRTMLSIYKDLPFVLIGDSGQHDPEVYAQVVNENPERIRAVYIRNVSSNSERHQAVDELAKQVAQAGSNLVLASDSIIMARHAAEHDLISDESISHVMLEFEKLDDG